MKIQIKIISGIPKNSNFSFQNLDDPYLLGIWKLEPRGTSQATQWDGKQWRGHLPWPRERIHTGAGPKQNFLANILLKAEVWEEVISRFHGLSLKNTGLSMKLL